MFANLLWTDNKTKNVKTITGLTQKNKRTKSRFIRNIKIL